MATVALVFVKIHVFEKKGVKRRLGSILGRSWVDLGRPGGYKMRAAEDLKRS